MNSVQVWEFLDLLSHYWLFKLMSTVLGALKITNLYSITGTRWVLQMELISITGQRFRLALFNVTNPSPEDRKRSSFLNVVLYKIQDKERRSKPEQPRMKYGFLKRLEIPGYDESLLTFQRKVHSGGSVNRNPLIKTSQKSHAIFLLSNCRSYSYL